MSEQQPGRTAQDGDRCPSCAARVHASQQWCTLCHGRLDEGGRAPVETQPVQPVQPEQVPEVGRTRGPASSAPGPAVPPGHEPVGPAPTTLPPGAAEAMLAELAASTAGDRPLSRGPLAGRTRTVRMALALGAGLVLALLGVGLLTLVGLLL